MNPVLRAAALYVALLLILRLMGKRSLAQVTVFDFVLLLIISEATQQALLGNDFSLVNALLVIITLVILDRGFDIVQNRSGWFSKLSQGMPLVLVEDGQLLRDRAGKERVSIDDIMQQARTQRGLERLDQVKFAVLERSGGISIIPREELADARRAFPGGGSPT